MHAKVFQFRLINQVILSSLLSTANSTIVHFKALEMLGLLENYQNQNFRQIAKILYNTKVRDKNFLVSIVSNSPVVGL